jgi:hypothetical protein
MDRFGPFSNALNVAEPNLLTSWGMPLPSFTEASTRPNYLRASGTSMAISRTCPARPSIQHLMSLFTCGL